ncbi:hypothetical protein J4429_00910 [Candidatus Pacearchaeota archaeon]|nr:hypothetical protein [Candidatus Pacearchaeota archaeon]
MEFNLDSYQPIDYRKWILGEESRQGINLRRLNFFRGREEEFFEESEPYHDRRNDAGHVEISLFLSIPISKDPSIKANRKVFGPAIEFHDNGYEGFVSPNQFREAILTKEGEQRVRLMHQVTVIKRAYQILTSLGYPSEYNAEILAALSDHDTRFSEPISDNEKVLQDADIAWRFTIPCTIAYKYPQFKTPANLRELVPRILSFQVPNPLRDFLESPEEILRYMQQDELARPSRFHIPASYGVARVELTNTFFNLFPDKAKKLLRKDFPRELERIVASYKSH